MRVCFNLQNIRFCGFYSFHVARLQLLYLDCPTQLFPGQLHTLHDISFKILIGCVWQIIGENSEILFVFMHVNFVVCVHPNQFLCANVRNLNRAAVGRGSLTATVRTPLNLYSSQEYFNKLSVTNLYLSRSLIPSTTSLFS